MIGRFLSLLITALLGLILGLGICLALNFDLLLSLVVHLDYFFERDQIGWTFLGIISICVTIAYIQLRKFKQAEQSKPPADSWP